MSWKMVVFHKLRLGWRAGRNGDILNDKRVRVSHERERGINVQAFEED